MKPIFTIFKKEFKDITRDRRSMMMFIIPMLLFPLLFTIAAAFTTRQAQKVRTKTLVVALITNGNAETFRETLLKRDDLKNSRRHSRRHNPSVNPIRQHRCSHSR